MYVPLNSDLTQLYTRAPTPPTRERGSPLQKRVLLVVLAASRRPDFYIAQCRNVQKRIKKYYNRDSSAIIHPAIDFDFFKKTKPKDKFFLYVSRLEPHKKPDLAVSAFNKLGLPLKIVGRGTMEENLQQIAKSNIEFIGEVSDKKLRDLYSLAKAVIYYFELH